MKRTRAWRRYKDYTKAKRKRDIDVDTSYMWANAQLLKEEKLVLWYKNLHQYSKNKIHCSCPMCSAKTRNKGHRRKRKNYAPSINYSRADLRKMMYMDASEEEYYEELNNG